VLSLVYQARGFHRHSVLYSGRDVLIPREQTDWRDVASDPQRAGATLQRVAVARGLEDGRAGLHAHRNPESRTGNAACLSRDSGRKGLALFLEEVVDRVALVDQIRNTFCK
jgi:hypothetical protein